MTYVTMKGRGKTFVLSLGAAALAVAVVAPAAGAATAKTKRVSVRSSGAQATDRSDDPSISANGRYVAFWSDAANLVSKDKNGERDIFVRNRKTKRTKRVSVRSSGVEVDGGSGQPSISADGRYVAFSSMATDLVGIDTNLSNDVFVHDRKTKKTRRVSVPTGGGQADTSSWDPSISADGRFVAFSSLAKNLVANDTNDWNDIFVHDRKTKKTKRVSVKSGGGQSNGDSGNPSISANGRFVAFWSEATNLVAGDTNGKFDIYVHDRWKKKTKRVSVKSDGGQSNGDVDIPSISGDGRFVAFRSDATDLVGNDTNGKIDVFVHDRRKKRTKRVSVRTGGAQASDSSVDPSISANGRYVAFRSRATDLVGFDTNGKFDVFVHDRWKKKTKRVSVKTGGAQANDESGPPRISADGRFVAFASKATNLVANDTNTSDDIFVRGPLR
jgi:Tol biopolymer transport system component